LSYPSVWPVIDTKPSHALAARIGALQHDLYMALFRAMSTNLLHCNITYFASH